MAFRGKEMMKKVLKRVGENNLNPRVKESLEKCIPRSKVVMGRAKRGLFAASSLNDVENVCALAFSCRYVFLRILNCLNAIGPSGLEFFLHFYISALAKLHLCIARG
ncbi:uncharacterized protein DS421_4g127630 [Arachis hypogaea]|nr:uncharacterized protein DS421_4g127630 [Arachis hypogaea]